jgi:ATP-dependent Clp protease ATP-binding subunit ClpA
MNSLNKLFSPEFRNRLDETIQFNYLDKNIILSIVDKFLVKLQAQLDKRNVEIVVTKKVVNWIAENGYDKEMGARPMERFISKNIKKPLVDKLLFGNLKSGGVIKLDMEKGKLKFIDSKSKVKA